MPNTSRIAEYRPGIVLAVLVTLSLASLATGAQGNMVSRGVHRVVGVATYPFLVAMASVEDAVSYGRGFVLNYNEAIRNAEELRIRLAEQMHRQAHLAEMAEENERLRSLLEFQQSRPDLDMLPARVIQRAQGTLTIDRGARDGIKPSMCVITARGVVGMVTQVEPFSASVVTLQNPECRIDVMIQRNRVRGRVHGTGNDLSTLCRMFYIDISANVREGDEIVTSPDSIFPSGYPVGRVFGTPYRGPLTQSAEVVPTVDPFRLDEVFVLLRVDRPAADFTRGDTADDEPLRIELADVQTLQERFAP